MIASDKKGVKGKMCHKQQLGRGEEGSSAVVSLAVEHSNKSTGKIASDDKKLVT